MIYLYRKPLPREYIILGADPAEGGDYSAWVAYSKQKQDILLVGLSKTESPQLGHELNHIGKWINKITGIYPSIAVERNVGTATIYVLKELNYPNLYRMPDSFVTEKGELAQEKYGWQTSMSSRPKMLDDLAVTLRQKVITIPSKHIVEQLSSFIRNERTGRPEADKGSHDDLVMALAIALQVSQTESAPLEFDDSEIPDDTKRYFGNYS